MTATFRTDERGGVTVSSDGHPQSYVDRSDPAFLPFEYMQHIAALVDVQRAGRLGVTHIGGAGLTLPRYVEHVRPGSTQIVLEPDAELTERVRRELPLPRGHRIRVRAKDGASGVPELRDEAADLIVLDAFAGGRVPAELTRFDLLVECARVLRPGGVFVANLGDEPGARYVARVAATAAEAGLTRRVVVATHDVLKGKRYGNYVLAASAAPLDEAALHRRLLRSPFPTGLRGEADVRVLARGARPFVPGDDAPSPVPPEAERWRAR